MRAAILAVGTELLGVDRLDTNSLLITTALTRAGVCLVEKAVVTDGEQEIAATLGSLAARCDLVVVTGGLGPTRDDRTREAVALLAGVALEEHAGARAAIEDRYRAMGRRMPDVNLRQALVPAGARVLDNDRGTAPGLEIRHGAASLFLFPGVPRELEGMIDRHLAPWLEERAEPEAASDSRELRVACMAESWVEEWIEAAYEELGREAIAVLASPGEVRIRLTLAGPPAERALRLDRGVERLAALVGSAVFTTTSQALEEVLGELLGERSQTLSVAESCTGGLVGQRLTSLPGSSAWFEGGAIVYSNRLKNLLLGVPEEQIASDGAVSERVAASMAIGARARFATTWAVSVTGVAGPGGGSVEKPVGTVCFGLAGPGVESGSFGCYAATVRFPGDRTTIRRQSAQFALELVRRAVLGLDLDILAGLIATPTARAESMAAATATRGGVS